MSLLDIMHIGDYKYKVQTDGLLSFADQKKLDVCVQMVAHTCLHMV